MTGQELARLHRANRSDRRDWQLDFEIQKFSKAKKGEDMSTTAATTRVEQLKRELADAEAAAQQVKKTVASELAEADKAVNEAQRLVTINKARLAEEVAALEGLSKEGASIQGLSGLRVNHDLKTQRVNRSVHELEVERDRLAGELSKKQCTLGQIVKQIAEHPAYKAVRAK